jgi:hypothetical protein
MVKQEDYLDLTTVTVDQLWSRDKRFWVFGDDVDVLLNVDHDEAKRPGFYQVLRKPFFLLLSI